MTSMTAFGGVERQRDRQHTVNRPRETVPTNLRIDTPFEAIVIRSQTAWNSVTMSEDLLDAVQRVKGKREGERLPGRRLGIVDTARNGADVTVGWSAG